MSFSNTVIAWYEQHHRDLPWRHTTDPYIIWLSEIILQQTRVEQGRPYFERFLERFPAVQDFAEASEDDILHLWQGLGYYSRGRNMHKAAKLVMTDFEGLFPTAYKDLIKLPGIGEYTAAAISSFSSNEAQAVLDGNVFRVLARYFNIDSAINSSAGKKIFTELAQELLPAPQAALYNQAIMEFGALQCKPQRPDCAVCPLLVSCEARRLQLVGELPVKIKAKKSKKRYFNYFLIEEGDYTLMSKRGAGDVWENLYEFPLIETAAPQDTLSLGANEEVQNYFGAHLQLVPLQENIKHILSHQDIFANFYKVLNVSEIKVKKSHWDYVLSKDLNKLAKHKLIFSFLERFSN